MAPMAELVQRFREELAGADFICDSPLGGRQARVRFIGRFAAEEMVWDAELIALTEPDAAQFLDIDAPGPRGIPIRIGLGVAVIDRPTLLKAIIMVRNYKLLRRGRHEFGPRGPVGRRREP